MEDCLQKKIDIKREKEKRVVKLMIQIYCKGHKHEGLPCESCGDLINYVDMKIDRCPFMETKTYCSTCTVHCYKKDMKLRIREVMRYSGPRMILHHPILVLDHLYQEIKQGFRDSFSKKKKKRLT